MKALSYEDWQLAGYQVMKGAVSTSRDPRTGVALFARSQVVESSYYNLKLTDQEREELGLKRKS